VGFSSQKPERRTIERNEQAVLAWKRKTLPALKKVCCRAAADRLHRRVRAFRAPHAGQNLGSQGLHADRAVPLQLETRLGLGLTRTNFLFRGAAQHKSRIVRDDCGASSSNLVVD